MINVSCVQTRPILNHVDMNLENIVHNIEDIMKKRPDTDLIVFPELATTGYEGTVEDFQEMAETVPTGKCMKAISKLCKKYCVNVVYGFAERDSKMPDQLYNSALFINNEGKILGQYRKVHPFDIEKLWCHAGYDYPIFETYFGRVGVQICWDAAFPEVSRIYALKGADLLIVITNWEKPDEKEWDLITKARAFDNILHLVASNRIGNDGGSIEWFGRSKIIDPLGRVINSLDEEVEGIIHAKLDLSITSNKRKEYTFFEDRRPDTYSALTKSERLLNRPYATRT